jgi:hypothetical protein
MQQTANALHFALFFRVSFFLSFFLFLMMLSVSQGFVASDGRMTDE